MRMHAGKPARQGHSGWVPRSRRERGKGREGDLETQTCGKESQPERTNYDSQ